MVAMMTQRLTFLLSTMWNHRGTDQDNKTEEGLPHCAKLWRNRQSRTKQSIWKEEAQKLEESA